ncbi:hypothetical protein [Aquiflexum sp.]|uniref:hypothetical protein n=1 Tax=Aquiflexum sp. TaxID=1872584 RepID=UPI003593E54D
MLTQTNGLPDYQDIMGKYWDKTKMADNGDLRKYHPSMLAQPREKYEYSNSAIFFWQVLLKKLLAGIL